MTQYLTHTLAASDYSLVKEHDKRLASLVYSAFATFVTSVERVAHRIATRVAVNWSEQVFLSLVRVSRDQPTHLNLLSALVLSQASPLVIRVVCDVVPDE